MKNFETVVTALGAVLIVVGLCVAKIALLTLCWCKSLVPIAASLGITLPLLTWWQFAGLYILFRALFGSLFHVTIDKDDD